MVALGAGRTLVVISGDCQGTYEELSAQEAIVFNDPAHAASFYSTGSSAATTPRAILCQDRADDVRLTQVLGFGAARSERQSR